VGLTVLPVLCLRWIDPPTSAFMLRSPFEARARGASEFRVRHHWVDWEEIAPSAGLAVIAAEDQRFALHGGFDVESIAEAVEERARGGRRRGASTISQQVAKNLFLWPGKSFARKALEAWFTAWIELLWSKQRILEVYLNVAQFGDGVFGIEAASRHFYAKPALALTDRESATLAAVLPNPRRIRAGREPTEYVRSRADWILEQMRMLEGTSYVRTFSKR
jgi:monofunctional biosynthetic peptidoglycan transglycosylase